MLATTIAAAAASAGVLIVFIALIIRRCSSRSRTRNLAVNDSAAGADAIRTGAAVLPRPDPGIKRSRLGSTHHYPFRRGASGKSPPSPAPFNWADYPSLIADAVDNGWAQFAFRRAHLASPSTRSALLGLCSAGDPLEADTRVETGWELSRGSEFVQKIRFNPGMATGASNAAASVIRTELPVPGPGPPLGSASFPPEAYIEIRVVGNDEDGARKADGEGERAKLIGESPNLRAVSIRGGGAALEEERIGERGGGGDTVALSLGLTAGGPLPLKHPGSYRGSIGFNSNGSVYLNGAKLALESPMAEWGQTNSVIGCGFSPAQKKVFFTVDSELVRLVQCRSVEFGSPLFPTLAANADVTVLVNFGQESFRYPPANAQRTANPCLARPLLNHRGGAALALEDSRELFSMGRIEAQWLSRSSTAKSSCRSHAHKGGSDLDQDSEADLFEIVLEEP